MTRLLTTTGKRIGLLTWDLSDNETSAVVVLRVIPAADFFLKASPADSDIQIQARKTGSADPFIDIASTPIDLSPLPAETPVDYDFRAQVQGALTDVRRIASGIFVSTQAPAAWDA